MSESRNECVVCVFVRGPKKNCQVSWNAERDGGVCKSSCAFFSAPCRVVTCEGTIVKNDISESVGGGRDVLAEYAHWRLWRRTTLQGLHNPPVTSQLVGGMEEDMSEDETGYNESEMIPWQETCCSKLRSISTHLSPLTPQFLSVSPREEESDGSVLNSAEFKPEMSKENHEHESNQIYINFTRLHFLHCAEWSLK